MNPYALTLIIVLAVVAVAALIMFFFPRIQGTLHQKNEKSPEEIAKDEVDSIVFTPNKESIIKENEVERENALHYIEKKEKQLGIIFSEDDIEALIIQMRQDRIDDAK